MKFRGAGQGPLALAAEIIAAELARRLGLRIPELVLAIRSGTSSGGGGTKSAEQGL